MDVLVSHTSAGWGERQEPVPNHIKKKYIYVHRESQISFNQNKNYFFNNETEIFSLPPNIKKGLCLKGGFNEYTQRAMLIVRQAEYIAQIALKKP